MRRTPLTVAVIAMACLLAGATRAQGNHKNGWHEDTKTGYKLKIPDKWDSVPIAVDEKWIVAKYLADRPVSIKKGEWAGAEAKPQLRVIVFSDEARKVKPAEAKVEKTPEDTIRAAIKSGEVPYKDYKDYIKRNGQDGGYYFDKEKTTKIGEMPCCQYEIKFEKLTVPRRVVAWVFRGDAADYAVEYEVLEDSYEKFLPIFMASLQSFKLIKRDSANVGSSGSSTGTGGSQSTDPTTAAERKTWKSLSAKERADRRKSTEESRFRQAKEKLPQGWTVKTTPHFLVLSHSDQKTTDKIVDAAEACRNWLDKNLAGISDEYALRAVIRVCADYDEARAYDRGSDDSWGSGSREIVTFKDANMGTRSGYDRLFRAMLMQYLSDKDSLIPWYAPPWIITGLTEAVQAATPEGGTLKLSPDQWEADVMREAAKKGTRLGAKEIMEASRQKLWESPCGSVLAARLVRHFFATRKDFVVNYLKASAEVAAEATKDDTSERKEAATEEEEEAQLKERREAGQKKSAELTQKVHAKACSWSEKEWQALESAFAAIK